MLVGAGYGRMLIISLQIIACPKHSDDGGSHYIGRNLVRDLAKLLRLRYVQMSTVQTHVHLYSLLLTRLWGLLKVTDHCVILSYPDSRSDTSKY